MEEFSELLPLMVTSGHPPDGSHISERITHAGGTWAATWEALWENTLYGCFPNCSAEQNSTALLSYLR